MSRHTIPAKNPDHEIDVGWDQPMNTYFAQVLKNVIDQEGDDDVVILWIGGDFDECQSVEALAHRLEPYATLDYEMARTLRMDRAEHPGQHTPEHIGVVIGRILARMREIE
jgi:hypothetical protein